MKWNRLNNKVKFPENLRLLTGGVLAPVAQVVFPAGTGSIVAGSSMLADNQGTVVVNLTLVPNVGVGAGAGPIFAGATIDAIQANTGTVLTCPNIS